MTRFRTHLARRLAIVILGGAAAVALFAAPAAAANMPWAAPVTHGLECC
ncbi:hypothetical protein Ais01nite_21340 [Asanoa ishikariensis]|uniref:Uncharacterized protein n=1 Tax=Asanoa ishikariensis TaxID=137265 RepID=A0A1H3UAL9_9ACTN|nr:hypothetical protein [Asanoa ishikariensis]GIF64099.1 hypothetical protein Ais01nite_21340 [Asanoa ishikariensis]SDZ58629.1 hypothetical protein SAMN05421684_6739 [Asanoa ishikariensis]